MRRPINKNKFDCFTHSRGWITFVTIATLAAVHCCVGQAARESYEAEYFTNASLPCNFTLHNLTYPGIAVPFKKYWILPNTTVLPDTYIGGYKFRFHAPDPYTFNLLIDSIDDPDFGVYHCVMLWENIYYTTSVIRVALNEDGPLYKRQLEKFQRDVLIGCVCAGAVVLIIIIGCAVCRCRNKKAKNKNSFSNVDFYAQRSKDRHASYEYDVNTDVKSGDGGPEPRQLSVDEVYAKVNKTRTGSRNDEITVKSEHL